MADEPDKGRFLSVASIYIVSNIVNACVPFLLLPVLTRHLDPSEYGKIAMFQVLLGAVGALVGLSVDGAASRKYFDRGLSARDARHFIASCLQILVASSGVVLAGTFVFRVAISNLLDLPEKWVLWAVIVSAGSALIQIRLGQWMVRRQAIRYGSLQVGQSVLNVSLSLILVVLLHWGADGRIMGQSLSILAFAVVAFALMYRDRLLSFLVWRPDYLREALSFGLPLVPHIAGIYLLSTVDRLVVNSKLGLAEAGIYVVAVQLSTAMALVFDAINKAYVPWLYDQLKAEVAERKRQIVRFTYAWYAAIASGVALAFLVGPALVSRVVGDQYAGAGQLIGWLCLGQGLSGMYLMVTNYVFYSKRTGLLSAVTIFSGVLNVGLLLLLVESQGLAGAAIAYSIAMGVRFLLTWWVAQRRYPMPWLYFLSRNG
jgi:O-antigen/teichoic acid export membrane protein